MRIVRLTDISADPVTLAEAKAHLRISFDDDDDEITAFIKTARRRIEDYCNRLFVSASYAVLFDGDLPAGDSVLSVPVSDVTSVTSVKYRDLDGTQQTWDSSDYSFDDERQELRPVDAWPDGTELRVEVVAGASSASDVPSPIKTAILLYVGEMYENREAGNFTSDRYELNPGTLSLVQPYRDRMGI